MTNKNVNYKNDDGEPEKKIKKQKIEYIPTQKQVKEKIDLGRFSQKRIKKMAEDAELTENDFTGNEKITFENG